MMTGTIRAKAVYATVVFLSIISTAFSQDDCGCDVYEKLTKTKKSKSEIYADVIKDKSNICQAKALELLGVIAVSESNNLDSAEFYLKKAEAVYNKTDCGEAVIMKTYKQRFQVYWSRSDFPNAQDYGLKFLHSAELAKNMYEQAIANTMIAVVFYKTKQFEKGLVFNDKAAGLLPGITDKKNRQNIFFFFFSSQVYDTLPYHKIKIKYRKIKYR